MRKRRPPPKTSAAPRGSSARRGQIVAHLGVAVLVDDEDGRREMVRVARRSGHVVGDDVIVDDGRLERLERRTVLTRRAAGGHGAQLIAANVDALGLVVSRDPPPRVGLIDRAVVAARAAGIAPFIVVNKLDLDGVPAFLDEVRGIFAPYLEVLGISVRTGEGLADLEHHLQRTGLTVFMGPSGVGKSSLSNALVPKAELEVGALSEATGRGRHTTTTATLHQRDDGIRLIDTPGIRDFGLVEVSPEDLAHHFPGFEEVESACRFRDCLHRGEPGCAVEGGVATGAVREDRLVAYRALLAELGAPAG